jgi:hypothetical protein
MDHGNPTDDDHPYQPVPHTPPPSSSGTPAEEQIREAVLSPSFSHSRCRPWCRQMIVTIYHFAPQSPSGVLMAADCTESEFDAVLAELRAEGIAPAWAAPLSPTEGL